MRGALTLHALPVPVRVVALVVLAAISAFLIWKLVRQ